MSELPQQIQDWIGKVVVVDEAEVCVEQSAIENFCSAVEDGNPRYWQEGISPPGMLSAYNRPHPWTPTRGNQPQNRPLELHFRVKDLLQLPRGIVSELGFEFGVAVRVGDKLRAEQSLREVSELKTNKLGTGRSWVIDVTYKNQRDEIAGIETLNFFGYNRN
ncbi:MAG: MaoC family dehydratase N-terminal domain-containing protein [Pseudomonadales bacterium]